MRRYHQVGKRSVTLKKSFALQIRQLAPHIALTQISSDQRLQSLSEGKSIAEISRALNVAYKTVANNCSAMKRKLGVSSMAELDGREAKVLDASEV